jgi:hypothetical protein
VLRKYIVRRSLGLLRSPVYCTLKGYNNCNLTTPNAKILAEQ